MGKVEQFNFDESESILISLHTQAVSFTQAVAYTTDAQHVTLNDVAHKVEPVSGGHLNDYSRVIFWAAQNVNDTAGFIQSQLQMSRDGTAWVDVGAQFDSYYSGAALDSAQSNLMQVAQLPTDFMTVAAGATDVDDVLLARMEVVPAVTDTGTYAFGVMMVPGLSASQTIPTMGNVFSGPAY